MLRKTVAWILIVVGLAAAIGGVGMVIVFTITDDTAAKNAQVEAAMNPNGLNFGPRRDVDPVWQYISAGSSILIGGALAFAGLRLRAPRGGAAGRRPSGAGTLG